MNHKKTLLSVALAGALGVSAAADAGTLTATWTGAFTMLLFNGAFGPTNTDIGQCYPGTLNVGSCIRTAISGTLTYDTDTRTGSGTVVPFSFLGTGNMSNITLNLEAIGNGLGGPGNLILGNMGFNWNANNGVPVSIVLDAQGFFGALAGGLSVSQTITGGATPASNATQQSGTTYPIGPGPMVTTTWNTTKIGTPSLGTNPSGTLPLITDTVVDTTNGDIGIGGSPMTAGPFKGFNANFDILSMHIESCAPNICSCAVNNCPPATVPIPAAVWLFGSGLVGLAGIARRKRRSITKLLE